MSSATAFYFYPTDATRNLHSFPTRRSSDLMATRTTEAAKKPAGAAKHNMGKVVQVIGPVLDVEFEPERLPELYNALVIDHPGNGTPPVHLVAEVQQHIGRNQVRAVAMSSTDGVVR